MLVEDDTISHVRSTNRGLFKDILENLDQIEISKLDSSNDIYDVVVDRDLTNHKFFNKLKLNIIYLITIGEAGISLHGEK